MVDTARTRRVMVDTARMRRVHGRRRRISLAAILATAFVLAIGFASSAQATVVCTIIGTAGGEKLTGTAGDDVICGLGGNDRLNGRGGNDILLGDDGDDQLIGEAGIDELDGGAGTLDTANFAPDATEAVDVDLGTGAVANDGRGSAETILNVERVEGAHNQANTLIGDGEDNQLIGGLLNDDLSGTGGADLLRGEIERAPSGGNDQLLGGAGADTLFPGLGSNQIDGEGGSDTLAHSGLGAPTGINVINTDGSGATSGAATNIFDGIENVIGTPQNDLIQIDFTGTASLISARDGDDALSSADGDALDTMNGGTGTDLCFDAGDGDARISC